MTKHDLKELAAMGAELGAAKAEVERLRGLLTTAWRLRPDQHYHEDHLQAEQKAWEVEVAEVLNAAAALSRQAEPVCQTMQRPKAECGCPDCGSSLIDWPTAEPTGTYTAVEMATAAAHGFRDGQAAVEPAPAQDEREAFDLFPDQLKALAERLKQYREAHKDDVCSPQEVLRQCKAWAGSDQYHGTGTGDSFQRAADLIEALLAAPIAQTEQPEQSGLINAEWSEHGPSKPCPFHNPYLSKVDIRLRDGTEKFGELACNHTWFWYEHSQAGYDIVAYRPALSAQGAVHD